MLGLQEPSYPIWEMGTVSRIVKWGKSRYKMFIHGPSSKDKEYPHIHIYAATDYYPYNLFNFEVSLIDIVCKDEINFVCQQDKDAHINY